jgi:hypothetical protein
MGPIGQGVRESLRDLGIAEPRTAIERLAILIAEVLDTKPDDKTVAALSRELRLTLDKCADQPVSENDPVEEIIRRQG